MRKVMKLFIGIVLCTLVFSGCGGEKAVVKLMPQDANLADAPNVVVEPNSAPYNLGGWLAEEDIVEWDAEITKKGMYHIAIEYARPGSYPATQGIIRIATEWML